MNEFADDHGFDESTEEREAARGLEYFNEMLSRAETDTYFWKWAIFALHSAVHGFFVLALRGTRPVRLLNDKDMRKALRKEHEGPIDFAVYEDKIAPFMELYERTKVEKFMGQMINSRAFEASPRIDEDIRFLNEMRNEMMHYRAMTHVRSIADFFGPLQSGLRVIAFLHNESGNVHWRSEMLDENDRAIMVDNALSQATATLVRIKGKQANRGNDGAPS